MERKALTLIELLVSVLILALMAAGMGSLFFSGKKWVLHSRASMAGGELGKYFLDPLQMEVNQSTWDTSCVGANICPPASVNPTQTLDNINYNATYNSSPVTGTTLRRVRVTINWTERAP